MSSAVQPPAEDDDVELVDVSDFIQHHKELDADSVPMSPMKAPGLSTVSKQATAIENRNMPDALQGMMQPKQSVGERRDFIESPFWEDYARRVSNGQDLLILVSDYHNDRGTGKTVLSIDLAETLDRTEQGLVPEKASLAPQELINGYKGHEKGSALILDEAEEGMNAREAMTKVNRMMSKIASMGRVMEKYVIMNMPASNHIDKNILDLAHYWFLVTRRGLCRVYKLKNNPFEQKKYPTAIQQMEWSDISNSHPVYKSLTAEKMSKLDDPTGTGGDTAYIPYEEHVEEIEKAEEEARLSERNDIIWRMLQHPEVDVPQRVIGDCADVSQGTVYNVKKARGGLQ